MKVVNKNRNGFECEFIKLNETSWSFECKESLYTGQGGDGLGGINFIDPEGGPFIHVGDELHEYSDELPCKKIKKIVYDDSLKKYVLTVDAQLELIKLWLQNN